MRQTKRTSANDLCGVQSSCRVLRLIKCCKLRTSQYVRRLCLPVGWRKNWHFFGLIYLVSGAHFRVRLKLPVFFVFFALRLLCSEAVSGCGSLSQVVGLEVCRLISWSFCAATARKQLRDLFSALVCLDTSTLSHKQLI